MSEQKTISEFYEQDHDRLDELFKTFQKLKRSDFAKAKEAFKDIQVRLAAPYRVGRGCSYFLSGKRKPACPKAGRPS